MKRKYEGLLFEVVSVEPESLLKSSVTVTTVTNVPITIPENNVSVEDFQAGFSDGGVDFKDLSF